MIDNDFLHKLFARGNSYWLTRFIILRLLGFVYAIAFLIAARQLVPLVGRNGLTPAGDFLYHIHSQLGSRTEGMLHLLTLFWFGVNDQGRSSFRWMGFRIMVGAGLIKLRGDPCWRDLTCMFYHYETQPIPNPISRYLHFAPHWFHKLETFWNHIVELVVPWFSFGPRTARHIAG